MKTIKRMVLLIFLFFFWNGSKAQKRIEKEIYSHVSEVGLKGDLDTLVRSLTAAYPGDEMRQAESIYLWIKLNIRYDFAEFAERSSSPGKNDPIHIEDVLANRMGVCDEFSTLAQKMFEKAGIRCAFIGGRAKQGGDQFFQSVDTLRHAWNAIFLGGKWSLIDCTWASLSNAYGDSSDYYFMTAPEELIYSHYPDEEKWALLSNVPSYDAFKEFPIVTPGFFAQPHIAVPEQGYLSTRSGMVEIPAIFNLDSTIAFSLENTSNYEQTSLAIVVSVNAQNKKVFKIYLQKKGVYLLKIEKKTPMTDINPDLFKLKELLCFGITYN
jgi:hypothetical protein